MHLCRLIRIFVCAISINYILRIKVFLVYKKKIVLNAAILIPLFSVHVDSFYYYENQYDSFVLRRCLEI